ncbi:hypothetical protein [Mucilaginibacter sp.]|nr:hypothetical protein [Mucilaginibacter sp.]
MANVLSIAQAFDLHYCMSPLQGFEYCIFLALKGPNISAQVEGLR